MTYASQAADLDAARAALLGAADYDIATLSSALVDATTARTAAADQAAALQAQLVTAQSTIAADAAQAASLNAQVAALQAQIAGLQTRVVNSPGPGPAGYTELWRDEFEGTALDAAKWNLPGYKASFQSTAGSKADPANLVVADGVFSILSKWVAGTVTTGGIKSKLSLPASGGWYETRLRLSPGTAKCAVMLYPGSGWPPEIDLFEIGAGSRQSMFATVHVNAANDKASSYNLNADYTQYQTVGVRYGAGILEWTLNGVVVGTRVTNQTGKQFVPSVPMFPIFQTEAVPSSTPVDGGRLDVAWCRALVPA